MQVTSIEQSRWLVELGLDCKTADMAWYINPTEPKTELLTEYSETVASLFKKSRSACEHIPAWSLSRLLELMPTRYQMTQSSKGKVQLMLLTVHRKDYYENELKAAYTMICWLLENDLFDAEKLKNYVSTIHCCFCGKEIKGKEAHSAQPVRDDVCCLSCNNTIVVPERIKLVK